MLKGSIVALITPFDKDGNIDWEGLEKLLDFHIKNGTDAILVLGTTGEPPALSEEEKDEIFKFVSEKIFSIDRFVLDKISLLLIKEVG